MIEFDAVNALLFILMCCCGVLLYCAFQLLVWLPLQGFRNEWVYRTRIEMVRTHHDTYDQYWTYDQMFQHLFTKDIEKMKGPYRKPWWVLWGEI